MSKKEINGEQEIKELIAEVQDSFDKMYVIDKEIIKRLEELGVTELEIKVS